jgi:hypothetical protein
VLVELDLLIAIKAVEVIEEEQLFSRRTVGPRFAKVLDKSPWVDFLLDVERDGRNGQGTGVLFILPPPDELRVCIRVTWV